MEAGGLRATTISGPGDVVSLDFFAGGRHLGIDAVVTSVYMNTYIASARRQHPGIRIQTCRGQEVHGNHIIKAKQPIAAPHGGPHVLVPVVIDDGGKLGVHAKALLATFATYALA